MAQRDDIEFVADEDHPAASEDVLALGPRRRLRWLIVLVGLAVVAVAATVIARNSGHPSAAAHPSPSPSVSVRVPRPVPIPVAPGAGLGAPLTRGAQPALDVALVGGRVWTVQGGRLVGIGAGSVRRVRLPSLGLSGPNAFLRMVPDGTRGLWLVSCGTSTARIVEYDTTTLQPVRDVRWRSVVQDAVALDGRLFLSTDRGVATLGPTLGPGGGFRGAPRLVPGLYGAVGPIAADPVRHRLIALDLGVPIEVWIYRPGSKPVEVSSGLSIDLRGLAVTARGAIWVGGFTHDGGQLLRLDPHTLRPVRRVLPDEDFGPGAIVLAGGDRVVWVRAGDGTDRLACVDADTGTVEQSWPGAPGRVASRHGAGYLAGTGGLAPLHLHGCTG